MTISLYLFPVIIISAFFGILDEYLLMFLALMLHEAAHLLAVKSSAVEISDIRIEAFGIKINLKDEILKDPLNEIKISAAGPLASIACGLLCLLSGNVFYPLHSLALPNLCIGFFNLLPVYPSDGGRILRAYLSLKTGYIKSYNTVKKITVIFSFILVCSGIYILYVTRFNFSFCITGAFLIYGVLSEKNHTAYYLNRELNSYKEKSSSFERMDILRIAVNENYPVRNILGELTLKRYCIAEVFKGHKKIGEFTEGELMEAMIKKDAGILIKDIYNQKNT